MTFPELVNVYENYSDTELVEVYERLENYSLEAKEALFHVAKNRGGIELLQKNKRDLLQETAEIRRIREEVTALKNAPFDVDFLSRSIVSEKLNETQLRDVILQAIEERNKDIDDRKIKPRTFVAGIPAAILASVLAGIMWGLQMMWSGRIFYILFIGVILICYGIIKASTKQSYKNTAVIILTIIAVAVALLIGQLMLELG